jgi:hypothetical protein
MISFDYKENIIKLEIVFQNLDVGPFSIKKREEI